MALGKVGFSESMVRKRGWLYICGVVDGLEVEARATLDGGTLVDSEPTDSKYEYGIQMVWNLLASPER